MNVGILRFRNDSLSETFEVYRGNKDFNKIGQIVSIDGKRSLNHWYGEGCNKVAGSYDESLLQPFLTQDSISNVYGSDICTSLPMSVVGSMSYKGVDCLKFSPDKKFLGSVVDYPENFCYCPGSIEGITLGQSCLRTGAMEFAACQAVPVVLGFPHFYRASSRYQNAVGGLSPHQDKHESFVALEPTTGIPIEGAKRIQINFQVKGTPAMTMTKNAPDTLMPFLWLDEQVELGDEQLSMIKDTLLKMLKIFNIVNWVLIAVGSLMVFVGCLMSFLSARRERSHPD
uniref:Sensory neuron membrane protein 2 n=1 Tax=Apolygus lucorum TaxID=248454 RepID=A0A7S5FGZ1_APOLU|nr:sensory neuron membrane protein 2b [Apolygus lucorum]